MKNIIGGVATAHYVMQKQLNVHKESICIRNNDSIFFLKIVNHLNHFLTCVFENKTKNTFSIFSFQSWDGWWN